MPTQKKKVKKATETTEAKATVDIKQEPEELKPLSAFVDDRLELIRQVFSCVKPKEIKYLLPDFLEGKSNDIIKERCLDELLGISTKRLHSIINNTKCPTDTESSSEGSDVEKIEEHISLDEISSDSDVDSKRVSKRSKKGKHQCCGSVRGDSSVEEKCQEEEKPVEAVKLSETEKPSEQEASTPVEQEPESKASEENVVSATAPDEDDEKEKDNGAISGSLQQDEDEKRESSPEVIPVEASPETLCISSDSEEERLAKERASIFVPNIEELDRQAKKLPTPEPEKPAEDTEPEEGEISEEEPAPPEPEVAEQQTDPTEQTGDMGETAQQEMEAIVDGETGQPEAPASVLDAETVEKDKEGQQTEIQTLSSNSETSDGSSSGSSSDSSTDAEDDEANKGEPTKLDNSAHDDEDIVEIHDSGDENLLLEDKPPEEEAKSWNTRWLKSSRVAKVMAASRLGNKVREKLKKKKQIQLAAEQQQQQQEPVVDSPEVSQPSPKAGDAVVGELSSNIELGSVEHYRELVAQQESKQD
uniref:Uncharacterized protein n=1 Tax=Anopheles minimus TaxID=112268 RepID=A0A182VRX1_9DIPT